MGVDAMTLYHWARKLNGRNVPLLPKVLRKALYYLHNSYVPFEAEIGEGTTFGYGGIGIVLHKDSKIGRYCLISQGVTLGGRSGLPGAPVLGDYVRVGAGAKILGNIRIGDFAVIGANAVVTKDVRPGAIVAGVPAKELRLERNPATAYKREMGWAPPEVEALIAAESPEGSSEAESEIESPGEAERAIH